MNGIVRPKGHAPVGIYWRRRLVLVAVVLLAAAGVTKLVGGGDEPDAAASSASTGETGGSRDSGDRKGAGDDRDRKRKPRAGRDDPDVRSGTTNVRVRMASAKPCDPARVTVSPSLLPDTYAGDDIPLRLGFGTGGDQPCVLSLTEHTPLISVSADGKTVWSSQKCSDLFDTRTVRVEPDWTTYVDARWSGRASGSSCGSKADFAEPGDYTVQAALLGGEPSKATITLEKAPKNKSGKNKSDSKNKNDSKKNEQDKKGGTDRDDRRARDTDDTDDDSGRNQAGPDRDRNGRDGGTRDR